MQAPALRHLSVHASIAIFPVQRQRARLRRVRLQKLVGRGLSSPRRSASSLCRSTGTGNQHRAQCFTLRGSVASQLTLTRMQAGLAKLSAQCGVLPAVPSLGHRYTNRNMFSRSQTANLQQLPARRSCERAVLGGQQRQSLRYVPLSCETTRLKQAGSTTWRGRRLCLVAGRCSAMERRLQLRVAVPAPVSPAVKAASRLRRRPGVAIVWQNVSTRFFIPFLPTNKAAAK